MGWFDGVSEVGSHHGDRHRSSGRHHGSGSIFGTGDHKHNSSRSSFFGFNNRSSSYYKRSPRQGYIKRVYSQLRRLLRDLIYYMKRHPMKVFMLVIMPLITGGALTGLLAKFGIRLPAGLEKMFGVPAHGYGGGSVGIGRGYDGGMQWERTRSEGSFGDMGALGGLGAAVGSLGGLGGAVSLAKMFM